MKEIRGRFVNLISFLYAILIKTGKDYDNHMSFCYNLSRKVSSLSCIHLLIKGWPILRMWYNKVWERC